MTPLKKLLFLGKR